jgi:hypothetical protein
VARLECLSFSWIDGRSLPSVDTVFMLRAAASWPYRVVMGLVATSNPPPPMGYTNVADLLSRRQYRAAERFVVDNGKLVAPLCFVDPGYTPPFDKAKLASFARDLVPVDADTNFYPGESSAISAVVTGALHGSSSLTVPPGYAVVASQLIKFRAGAHTDGIGLTEAKSPVHVPWVWCEQALIQKGNVYRLLGCGSKFPSHAWYVNGQQVAEAMQAVVTPSDKDSAISTGQPGNQPQQPAVADKSSGRADTQLYAIGAGTVVDVDVSRYGR